MAAVLPTLTLFVAERISPLHVVTLDSATMTTRRTRRAVLSVGTESPSNSNMAEAPGARSTGKTTAS